MSLSFVEETTPRAGLKASLLNVGNHYTLDVAAPAGVVVVPGSAAGFAKLPVTGTDVAKALGGLAYDVATPAPDASDDFAAGVVAEVVDDGAIWLIAEETLTVGNQVYVRHTAAGAEQLGAVRSDADGTDAALLPNSRVLAVATGLAKVQINLPYGAAA